MLGIGKKRIIFIIAGTAAICTKCKYYTNEGHTEHAISAGILVLIIILHGGVVSLSSLLGLVCPCVLFFTTRVVSFQNIV